MASQWWDIRAENGDLLARIKALTYDDALAHFISQEARRASGPGTPEEYGRGFDARKLLGTIH
jgi:hypothetical protein